MWLVSCLLLLSRRRILTSATLLITVVLTVVIPVAAVRHRNTFLPIDASESFRQASCDGGVNNWRICWQICHGEKYFFEFLRQSIFGYRILYVYLINGPFPWNMLITFTHAYRPCWLANAIELCTEQTRNRICVTQPLVVYKTVRRSLILPTKTLVRTHYVQFTYFMGRVYFIFVFLFLRSTMYFMKNKHNIHRYSQWLISTDHPTITNKKKRKEIMVIGLFLTH